MSVNPSEELPFSKGLYRLTRSPRWHQDIKPANILVFTRGSKSPYEHFFKLADFGLSHFKSYKGGIAPVTDLDSFGTRTYGKFDTVLALHFLTTYRSSGVL